MEEGDELVRGGAEGDRRGAERGGRRAGGGVRAGLGGARLVEELDDGLGRGCAFVRVV